jgi:hypothetical protein
MQLIGVRFKEVHPRMSRDFLVVFGDPAAAADAERLLQSVTAGDGAPLFEVDNRGCDLFVVLTYACDIGSDLDFRVGAKLFRNLRSHVSFVAIKNGEHSGTGYFVDTGVNLGAGVESIALSEIPTLVCRALLGEDADWQTLASAAG